MKLPIDWNAMIAPLDVMNIPVSQTHLRRVTDFQHTSAGLLLTVETAAGQPVPVQIDAIRPDVLRLRMNPQGIRHGKSDILIQESWPTPPFDIHHDKETITILTERMRIVIQRFPWQLRAYDRQTPADAEPFFAERINDRAYGYAYEVPPIGYEEDAGGLITVHETIEAHPAEAVYGFGEKFTPLNKRGQELASWAIDCGNVSSYRSYKNVPFFMSTAGYGLFIHTSFPIVYRIGSESSITYSFHIADSQLDYFLIYGPSFKHILSRYTELTGRAPVPPKWSFGFWISRCGYKSRQEVEKVVEEMRARGFPCDVLSLDPWWMGDGPWCTYEWDEERFPRPAEMIAGLRRQGIRTCLWITPYIPAGTPLYEEGREQGYFIRRPDGSVSPVLEAFAGRDLAAVDFTNPSAVEWFLAKLRRLLDMGVAVFKTDFGEQAPADARCHDGRSGLEMHNLYPLLYNRAVFELTRQYFGRGLTWGRSAYAGSQRYPVQWGGDSYSSLDQMRTQLLGLLSYGMSGVPFCSHDVGGFDYPPEAFDQAHQEDYPRDPVVYARWLQFGVFSSHVRAHGKQPREPWEYGPEVEAIARRYLSLRYRLLPYIYSEAVRSCNTGLPLVRPLVLEYQEDRNTWNIDHEYLFGDSFLVAPAITRDGRLAIYLPAGTWFDYWTKSPIEGGRWIDIQAPLDVLPLWVRAGSIIPMGPEMDYVDQKPCDPLTLELYAPQERGSYTIFDEDRASITVQYECRQDQLTVQVDPAPGDVILVVYGTAVRQVLHEGKTIPFERLAQGVQVRCDGRQGVQLTLELEP
ncbi:MAG: TIM-barrel domain-containing protein [Anaerolineae bacterium]